MWNIDRLASGACILMATSFLVSCSQTAAPPAAPVATKTAAQAPAGATTEATSATPGKTTPAASVASTPIATPPAGNGAMPDGQAARPQRKFQPIQIGATSSAANAGEEESRTDSVMDALRPLQILLGKWKGNARKALLDQPEWVWDLTTNPKQPALVMSSPDGKYIREGRMTFLVKDQAYQLSTLDADGQKRTWQGNFTREVEDVAGDDQKLQRTYKLEFTETPSAIPDELWKLSISQQDNNRYLIELDRQRGSGSFVRVDTINTQREGTSFALNDSDYGDKECIISQGLGTMSVSYKGQRYWVCCTGCKSAFEEDPERWLAKLAEKKKDK